MEGQDSHRGKKAIRATIPLGQGFLMLDRLVKVAVNAQQS
jgi:hypothetical protein